MFTNTHPTKIFFPVFNGYAPYSPNRSWIPIAMYINGIQHLYNIQLNITYKEYQILDPYSNINYDIVYEFNNKNNLLKLLENYYKNNSNLLDQITIEHPDSFTFRYLKQNIEQQAQDTDYIFLSIWNHTLFSSLFMVLTAKRINPHIKIIVGGPLLTVSDNICSIFKYLNCIVKKGDIESILIDLIENNTINEDTDSTTFNISTDGYFPIYPLELMKKFNTLSNQILIQTVRGCIYQCKFCTASASCMNQTNMLSIETIHKIFEYYRPYINLYFFIDTNLYQTDERLINIFKNSHTINKGTIESHCLFNDETCLILEQYFRELYVPCYSIHSSAYKILTHVDKNPCLYKQCIHHLRKYYKGLLICNYFENLPYMSKDEQQEDTELIQSLQDPSLDLTIRLQNFKLYAGSYMYHHPNEFNITYIYNDEFDSNIPQELQTIISKIPYKWVSVVT
jgi:hypothetical protein